MQLPTVIFNNYYVMFYTHSATMDVKHRLKNVFINNFHSSTRTTHTFTYIKT